MYDYFRREKSPAGKWKTKNKKQKIKEKEALSKIMSQLILIIVVILILWALIANVRVVPQAQAYVIERLGKYKTTWEAGLHLKVPFIESIVKKVSLKEQTLDFPPQPVITKDNVTMNVDSLIFMKVMDPKLYTYGIANATMAVEGMAATTLRNIIGEMELDETLVGRDEINGKMQQVLDEATDPWGIKVTRVEIKNIQPPQEIAEVMSKQMRAERERRQTVLEAQAHQEAVVARAEGDKKAKILAAEAERDAQIALAEGRAKSIEMVYEAEAEGLEKLKNANVSDTVLKLKGIEALKDVADGRATKIFSPSDITSTVAALGVAGEALGIGNATAVDNSPKMRPAPKKDPCIDDETGKGGLDAAATTEAINEEVKASSADQNDVLD